MIPGAQNGPEASSSLASAAEPSAPIDDAPTAGDLKPADPTLTVVAALAERGGRVFLARRMPGGRDAGLWELPGGKVEAGEEPGKALERELLEELGLSVAVGSQAREYHAVLRGTTIRFLVFPLDFPEDPSALTAHDAFTWALPEDMPAFPLAPLDGPPLGDWMAGRFA